MSFTREFIETVSGKGECEMFIIHARKARLSGLSPKREPRDPAAGLPPRLAAEATSPPDDGD
ncbi:hypothetical protein LNP17_02175 [Klebsiella variicola subsp. variicola]|nr:hypothetical protein [Klebsiella variicola subsp. variicola]